MASVPPPGWAQAGLTAWSATYPLLNILLVRVLMEVAAVVLLGQGYITREQVSGEGRP